MRIARPLAGARRPPRRTLTRRPSSSAVGRGALPRADRRTLPRFGTYGWPTSNLTCAARASGPRREPVAEPVTKSVGCVLHRRGIAGKRGDHVHRPVNSRQSPAAAGLALPGRDHPRRHSGAARSSIAAPTQGHPPLLYQRAPATAGEVRRFAVGYKDAASAPGSSRGDPLALPADLAGQTATASSNDARRLKEESRADRALAERGSRRRPGDLPSRPEILDGWNLRARPGSNGAAYAQGRGRILHVLSSRWSSRANARGRRSNFGRQPARVHHALFFLDTTGEARAATPRTRAATQLRRIASAEAASRLGAGRSRVFSRGGARSKERVGWSSDALPPERQAGV